MLKLSVPPSGVARETELLLVEKLYFLIAELAEMGFFCLFFCVSVSRIIFFEEFHWPTNSSGLHIVLIMDTSSGTIS